MNLSADASVATSEKHVLITREFSAPPALVFQAWTDPAALTKWYAPNNCRVEIYKIDLRVGGVYHLCIHDPKHGPCVVAGVYQEIASPTRLSMTIYNADMEAKPVPPPSVGKHNDWPPEMLLTITLEDLGGKTKLTLTQNVREELAKQTGAYGSWLQMFDKLEAELLSSPA